MPAIGDKVFIKPAPAHCPDKGGVSRVLADAVSGRFLPVEGEAAIWSRHLEERLKHGEIVVGGDVAASFKPALSDATANIAISK